MNVFLISVQDVKDQSYLDNNIDDKTVKNAILSCQEQMIEPVIGTNFYEKLLSDTANGNMSLTYQNFIVQKLWKPLIHGTLYMVARNLLFRYTNSSIVTDSNQNATAIAKADLETLRYEEQGAFKHHINKLQLYLKVNGSTYPEYMTYSADDLIPTESQNSINFYYDEL